MNLHVNLVWKIGLLNEIHTHTIVVSVTCRFLWGGIISLAANEFWIQIPLRLVSNQGWRAQSILL